MLIRCPSCQNALDLPDGAGGQQVQCPICNAVFLVAVPVAAAPVVQVQTAPRSSPPPLPANLLGPSQPQAPSKPSGPEQDFGFGNETDERESINRIRRRAHLLGGASWLRTAAAYFILYILIYLCQGTFVVGLVLPRDNAAVIAAFAVALIILSMPSVFMFIGASHMRSGGSRGLIITAVVFDFVMSGLILLVTVLGLMSILSRPEVINVVGILLHLGLSVTGVALGITAGVKTLCLIYRPDIQELWGMTPQLPPELVDDDRDDWKRR